MRRNRSRRLGWATAVAAGLTAGGALAQDGPAWPAPAPTFGPTAHPHAQPRRGGPIRRFVRHTSAAIHEHIVGRPELFVEPPLGFSVRESFGVNRARAEQHRFTLYRSDFLAGTTALSPSGADRLTRLAGCVGAWPGPLVVEWTPDDPRLAQSRRSEVVALLANAGVAFDPNRVVIGPSAYPGQLGFDAANNYDALIYRDQLAPVTYTLPPNVTATLGTGGN